MSGTLTPHEHATQSFSESEEALHAFRVEAVMQRNAEMDGHFVFGVTSTGIYCRPSCPSRRPRIDRLRFFDTTSDARASGFRPAQT